MNINQKTVRVHMKGDGKARGFSRTLLILYCAVIAFPIIFVVMTSFKSTSEFYTNVWGLPQHVAWENYATAWNDAKIGQYMLNSVIIVSIVLKMCIRDSSSILQIFPGLKSNILRMC